MSDYIVLVVTCIGISVCLSGVIIGIIKGDIEANIEFIKSNVKSLWNLLRRYGDEIDILRARMTDLENKLKEMETTDNGK